jgi:penicillin-binding protein 1C
VQVLDCFGDLLRPYPTMEGRWRLPVRVADVDPRFVDALIAYEDQRFRSHRGIDLLAVSRAAVQFVTNARIVSGASTLTMQVARLLEPRSERTLAAKIRQAVRAVQIERALSKDEILALYLTLAPYGGNLEGVRAASLGYFGKEPKRLTLAEIALLVALPQSPEARRPDRNLQAASAVRSRVLVRIAGLGSFSGEEFSEAQRAPIRGGRMSMPALAPHAGDQAIAANPERRQHRLSIDAKLQRALEQVARQRATEQGAGMSVAIVAVEHATGQVRARVGSPSYADETRAGQVDMSLAVRSPGSTLKPFIYGIGFEDGVIHPETLIEDRPIRFGNYSPENFDLTFQGTVPVRKALQLSLNVPAVAVLDAIGSARFTARLRETGASLVLPEGETPGLAMGLGGVGVRLIDLAMLYAGLARGGNALALTEELGREQEVSPKRLLEPVAAWYVGNVLAGTPPPENGSRDRIAFKTGTSYGNRDAWSVGFDGKHTIAVWVGRPDGAPVPGLTGRTAAAPILFEAFTRFARIAPLPPAPAGALMATNSRLPLPLRQFGKGLPTADPRAAVRIVFPPNGARLDLGNAGPQLEPVTLKVSGGVGKLTLLANGLPVTGSGAGRTLSFAPEAPGFLRLTVMDARGTADSVTVRVQ